MSALPKYVPLESSIRTIHGTLTLAERCGPQFAKVRTSRLSVPQANGIRYENKVKSALVALAKSLSKSDDAQVEKNPWFRFKDDNGIGSCSPDAILWLGGYYIAIVVEIKYTWTPTASVKLNNLYLPVVRAALGPKHVIPLIICRKLTTDSPKPIERISTECGTVNNAVYQWLGRGELVW